MPRSLAVVALALHITPWLTSHAQDSVAAAAERPVSSGVFTPGQASRGETVFKVNCVSCHATSDYQGDQFKIDWVTKTAFDLFDSIRSLMPDDNPGILERQEYVDVVAYIFSLNSYPTGADDLPSDDDGLKKVRIDAPPAHYGVRGSGARAFSHPRVVRRRE